jgi:hypothetical protein
VDPLTPEQARRLARALLAEDDEEPARYGGGAMPLRSAPPARPRPLLILLRVLVFALVGAAATVLVAWGCVLRRDLRSVPPLYLTEAFGLDDEMDWHTVVNDKTTTVRTMRAGWPIRAMSLTDRYVQQVVGLPGAGMRGAETESHDYGLRLPLMQGTHSLGNRGTVPLRPLWPGFLVDTAFWGGAAFIVWSVPGFVRRRARRRRGRCVRCGYELKGLAVCPECGS